MSDSFGICAVCCREIPVKRDGRLRAHLAASSSPGHREQCDGSGSPSARLDLAPGSSGYQQGQPLMTRPAAFNAREEWLKADALYVEYEDMLEARRGQLRNNCCRERRHAARGGPMPERLRRGGSHRHTQTDPMRHESALSAAQGSSRPPLPFRCTYRRSDRPCPVASTPVTRPQARSRRGNAHSPTSAAASAPGDGSDRHRRSPASAYQHQASMMVA